MSMQVQVRNSNYIDVFCPFLNFFYRHKADDAALFILDF